MKPLWLICFQIVCTILAGCLFGIAIVQSGCSKLPPGYYHCIGCGANTVVTADEDSDMAPCMGCGGHRQAFSCESVNAPSLRDLGTNNALFMEPGG